MEKQFGPAETLRTDMLTAYFGGVDPVNDEENQFLADAVACKLSDPSLDTKQDADRLYIARGKVV